MLPKQVREAVTRFKMLPEDTSGVVLAVSGGADSVALLFAVRAAFPSLPVAVCHLHHGLRGKEADRDMEFVRKLCLDLGLPFTAKQVDAAAYAKETGRSVETAARDLRYEFYREVCREYGYTTVATAHTATDHAETVLFEMIRGTGLSGLHGIPPVRRLGENCRVIRPLITSTREQIESYLLSLGQPFVTDSTNLSDRYTRNYIRHTVMPAVKHINPAFEKAARRMSDAVYDAEISLDNRADECDSAEVSRLVSLDDAVRVRVIRRLYAAYTGGKNMLENCHITAICDMLEAANKSRARREICLPGRVSAVVNGGILHFEPTVRTKKNRPSDDL